MNCRAWILILAALVGLGFTTEARGADGALTLRVVDHETRQPIACRMHLKNAAGRAVRPPRAPFWHDHFVFDGEITLKLPRGAYSFEIERGPEYLVRSGHFTIDRFAEDSQEIDLERFVNMADDGWWSGELHIHRPLKDIEVLMRAEDLHVAPVITWWNNRNLWSSTPPPREPLVLFDENRFYHQLAGEDERHGGALLYFNLSRPLPLAGSQPEFPSPMKFVEQAREEPNAWIDVEKPFWWDVPIWLASGKVDSIGLANNHQWRHGVLDNEAWGKPRDMSQLRGPRGNGMWSEQIYYHVLNCGLRLPPSAGSASGVLPNPVGYNRMYVWCGADFSYEKWWENFRQGRVVVTNGPIMQPLADGRFPGHVFHGEAGERLNIRLELAKFSMRSHEPVSYLEVVKNGEVVHAVRLEDLAKTGHLPEVVFEESGWFLIRAVTDLENTYRFASSGPWYVELGDQPRRVSRRSAKFFLDWVNERAEQIDLENADQRQAVLPYHDQARTYWENLLAEANAE